MVSGLKKTPKNKINGGSFGNKNDTTTKVSVAHPHKIR